MAGVEQVNRPEAPRAETNCPAEQVIGKELLLAPTNNWPLTLRYSTETLPKELFPVTLKFFPTQTDKVKFWLAVQFWLLFKKATFV